MHYRAMDEIPVGEVVTAAMFLVNKHPTIVLFDSRASHSFMSQTFASKHDQKIIEVDKGGYSISLARATIVWVSHRCDFGHELDEWSWSSY